MQNQNYLAHYGVLGMRWGIRRSAEVTAAKAAHAKRIGKALDDSDARTVKNFGGKLHLKIGSLEYKKMRKAEDDNNRTTQKALDEEKVLYKKELTQAKIDAANRLYSLNSKGTNRRVATMSMGKAFAESYLMGSYGALKYNEAKASGLSTGMSAVHGILLGMGNQVFGYLPSLYEGHLNKISRKKAPD